MNSQLAFAFDRFVLDPVAGRLYGRSGALPLTPKASALLEYLASNAGRLLTKRELLDALGYRFIALVETVVPMDRSRPVDPIWICGAAHQAAVSVAH